MALDNIPATGYLRLKQILGDPKRNIPPIIPIGATSWWRGVKEGRFPKPYALGARATGWKAEDIRKLVEDGIPR